MSELGFRKELEDNDNADDAADEHENLLLHEPADRHNNLRQTGQRSAFEQFIEDFFELGNDEDHQTGGNGTCNTENDGRVHHGRFDLPRDSRGFFHERCESVENQFELTCGLAGAHHVEIEFVERFRMLGERFGKGGTGFNSVRDFPENLLDDRIFRLFFKSPERTDERQTRIQQNGKLSGENRELFCFNDCGTKRDVDVHRAFFLGSGFFCGLRGGLFLFNLPDLLDGGREHALIFQKSGYRFFVRGLFLTFPLFSRGVHRRILVQRHRDLLLTYMLK